MKRLRKIGISFLMMICGFCSKVFAAGYEAVPLYGTSGTRYDQLDILEALRLLLIPFMVIVGLGTYFMNKKNDKKYNDKADVRKNYEMNKFFLILLVIIFCSVNIFIFLDNVVKSSSGDVTLSWISLIYVVLTFIILVVWFTILFDRIGKRHERLRLHKFSQIFLASIVVVVLCYLFIKGYDDYYENYHYLSILAL